MIGYQIKITVITENWSNFCPCVTVLCHRKAGLPSVDEFIFNVHMGGPIEGHHRHLGYM